MHIFCHLHFCHNRKNAFSAVFSYFSGCDLKYINTQHRSKGLWMAVVTPQYTLKQEIRTLTKLQENTWTGSKLQTRQDFFSLNCQVLYISSSFWLLSHRTACKVEQIHKMTIIFTQNGPMQVVVLTLCVCNLCFGLGDKNCQKSFFLIILALQLAHSELLSLIRYSFVSWEELNDARF